MQESFYNVLIVGAGIIGLSLAVRLAQSGIRVIIIDKKYPILNIKNSIPSTRVSAINYASKQFFQKINIWKNIPEKFVASYFCMKTWEFPSAMVNFNSNSIGLSEMGYIVENNRLKLALWQNILDSKLIQFYHSTKLISLKYNGRIWKCILDKNIIINSQLLIGADGYNSNVRCKMNIGITTWKHHQCCMLLTIKTEKNVYGTIWQMFTPNGPIGFLPLYDNWGSLMWFNTPEYIDKLKYLPKSMLERKIEKDFYQELGKISLYNISTVSVVNQRAYQYIRPGLVLIGDAAHTIHPLAGQGINLGIRDVIKLSDLLSNSEIFNKNFPISEKLLLCYQRHRRNDVFLMQSSINWLYLMFHNNFFPIKITRNLIFITIEKFPYAKNRLLKYAALGI